MESTTLGRGWRIRRAVTLASRLVSGPGLWTIKRHLLDGLKPFLERLRLIPFVPCDQLWISHVSTLNIGETQCELFQNH